MARTPLIKIRRLELQKAAYEVAYKFGFSGMTVEKVARHAGLSKGAVHHYFDSKHHLEEYATRYAHGILGRAAREKLKTARNASERVWAIVEANFLPEILTPEFFRLWFEVLDDKRLLYILDIFERRMRTNLVFALKQLADPREASDIAYEIMNFYDGFWALASIEPSITRKTALSQIAEFIKDVVPRFDLSVVKFDG